MNYDYYLQNDKTQSIRRYPVGSNTGERWNRDTRQWTTECCDRQSCELTCDAIIKEADTER